MDRNASASVLSPVVHSIADWQAPSVLSFIISNKVLSGDCCSFVLIVNSAGTEGRVRRRADSKAAVGKGARCRPASQPAVAAGGPQERRAGDSTSKQRAEFRLLQAAPPPFQNIANAKGIAVLPRPRLPPPAGATSFDPSAVRRPGRHLHSFIETKRQKISTELECNWRFELLYRESLHRWNFGEDLCSVQTTGRRRTWTQPLTTIAQLPESSVK